MHKYQSSASNYILPQDKLPECNLFTLFLRKQTQSSSDYPFERKKSSKREIKKDENKGQLNKQCSTSQSKVTKKLSQASITPERNVSKKKQIVYSNMKNLKKTTYHHLSVNLIDSVDTASSNKKCFNQLSYQKSRKPSLTIKDLSTSQMNQVPPYTTQRSQSSHCKTRKSSISADIAHRHSQRSMIQIQGLHNQSQNRTTRTEQSQERSNSKFKAKKMPNFQMPFVVYKSNKPLTTFTEFNFGNSRQRSSSGQQRNNSNSCRNNNMNNNNFNNNMNNLSHMHNINNMSSINSINKIHDMSVSTYANGKENSEYCSSGMRPSSSLSKSSNRSYLNENINYQNTQGYLSQQNVANFNTNKSIQIYNSQKGQNSNRIPSHQSSSIKDKQNINQIPKYQKSRQYA